MIPLVATATCNGFEPRNDLAIPAPKNLEWSFPIGIYLRDNFAGESLVGLCLFKLSNHAGLRKTSTMISYALP